MTSTDTLLYFSVFIAFLNSAINGYDLSLINGIIAFPSFGAAFNVSWILSPTTPSEAAQKANIINMLQYGSIVGCFFVGSTVDRLGRRRALQVGSAIIILGAIIEIATTNITAFMVGRFMIGFGVVFVTTAAPTYCVEIAAPDWRGRAGAIYNIGWNVGSIPASIILFGFSFITSPTNNAPWQVTLALQAVFSVIVFLGAFVIPESPRWLVSQGRIEEARAFFVKFHAHGDEKAEIVDFQMREITEGISKEKAEHQGSYWSLFDSRANIHRMGIVASVAFFSQYAGNWIPGYFQTSITQYFGITSVEWSLGLNVLNGVVSFIASLIGAYYAVEKFGRRPLLLYGTASYVLWYALIILCVGLFATSGNINAGIAGYVILYFFAISYSFTWTPLNALYPVEVLNNSNRAKGMAFCQLLINAAGVVQNYALSLGLQAYAWKFFSFYLVFNFVALIVIYFFYPETKGRTLEELDEVFQSSNPVAASFVARDTTGDFKEKEVA
jgi:sugar porter (SP) family MFS transporter